MEPLSRARERIEEIDRQLIRLIGERMDTVREVGALKGANPEAPLRDACRERELFSSWAREGEALGLSGYHLGRVLRELLTWSRRDQERFLDGEAAPGGEERVVRVAYQGARDAYSDLAARKLFAARGGRPRTIGCRTFAAALDALEAGEAEYALLPVENTIVGSLDETYHLLEERALFVVDEEVWPVEHCLAGLPGARVADLVRVRSHPVALAQCGRFLSGLPGVAVESFYDTAAAAAAVAEEADPAVAAVCSEEAARRAGLEVLARDLADRRHNVTRFLLLAREPEPIDVRIPARTSLLLTVNHRQGALAGCLTAFADAGVNLTKLESRPVPDSPWEYQFHVDVEGDASRAPLAPTLEALRLHTNHLRVLGSYPRRVGIGDEPVPAKEWPAAQAPSPAEPVEEPATAAAEPRRTGLTADAARTRIRVRGIEIGPATFTLVVGPSAVVSRERIHELAEVVHACGGRMLRGGVFHARANPHDAPGLDPEGLELLAEAGARYELPVVIEVQRPEDVRRVAERADVLQVGARSMQNFALLHELGHVKRPVLLERGFSATLDELLLAAEVILSGGNQQVILCERGIRTFETATRNTLDLSAVPVLRERTHLPILVDPSHAAGRRSLVLPLAVAAAAAGADGLVVEADAAPDGAGGSGELLYPEDLAELARRLAPVLAAQGRD